MGQYKFLQNDNCLGIRINEKNLRNSFNDQTQYPKTLIGNYKYSDMCSIVEWKTNYDVKNIINHVLPSEIDDINVFLKEDFDVPKGLSQTEQISSQCNHIESTIDEGPITYSETICQNQSISLVENIENRRK